MNTPTITTGDENDFFKRGRQWARLADQGQKLANTRTISFEDPVELAKLISSTRLALLRAVKEQPGSITALALRLHRDRSAVKRDVDELERVGLVITIDKVLPGHGKMREVRATAQTFELRATIG
jgi:predicted transcriptional regulator